MNLKDPNFEQKKERYPDHKQWRTGITSDNRVYIQDDNFEFDARFYIDGNFRDSEVRNAYAAAVARLLNEGTE